MGISDKNTDFFPVRRKTTFKKADFQLNLFDM